MSILSNLLAHLSLNSINPDLLNISTCIYGDKLSCTIAIYNLELDRFCSDPTDLATVKRNIKRAFGPFSESGSDGYKYLSNKAFVGGTEVEVSWYNTIECRVVETVKETRELSEYERERLASSVAELLKDVAKKQAELESGTREVSRAVYDCTVKS